MPRSPARITAMHPVRQWAIQAGLEGVWAFIWHERMMAAWAGDDRLIYSPLSNFKPRAIKRRGPPIKFYGLHDMERIPF